MKAFFLTFFLILFSYFTFSQSMLEMKNTKTGKSRILKQGSRFHIKTTHDSTFLKAKLVLVKDSIVTLYIQEFEEESPLIDIAIKDIKEIQKASKFHSITRGIGSVGLPIGSYLFVNGGLTLIRGTEDDKSQTVFLTLTGLAITGISSIPFIVKPNTYKKSDGWEFKMTKKEVK